MNTKNSWITGIESFTDDETRALSDFLNSRPKILQKIKNNVEIQIWRRVLSWDLSLEQWKGAIEFMKWIRIQINKNK